MGPNLETVAIVDVDIPGVDTPSADALAEEYRALTETCGLLDRSERGKLALSGPGAVEFLNGQVTNELLDLHPGEGCYAAFLTHKGKMLGDLRILAVGPDPAGAPSELLLDTERIALQALFDMIRRFKVGYEVELHKLTVERALLSLIGPTSEAAAMRALDMDLELTDAEHSHRRGAIDRVEIVLVRTNAGVDIVCDASERGAVCEALLTAGAQPVSEAAAEIVRVEHGRPRYGVDLDDTVIPQEAGLNERAVSFTKGCYVGQETVARLHYRGKPNRRLCGLRLSETGDPVTAGAELRLGERVVGRLTSLVISPRLGPIGLALVRREAQAGESLSMGDGGARAVVAELPFE